MKFELRRLVNRDDDSLLAELRRVAKLVSSNIITQSEFNKYAKVSFSTIQRRFGGWQNALSLAGLKERYGGDGRLRKGHTKTPKMSDEYLLSELHNVAKKLETKTLTMEMFNKEASINAETVRRRFGSWENALKKAGFKISKFGRRYSDDDYFENLLTVWTYYGRQPYYREMDCPPSTISSGAYENKWGTWSKALLAFVKRVNSDIREITAQPEATISKNDIKKFNSKNQIKKISRPKIKELRSITLGLRYDILRRDRFRCSICGSSPATDPQCKLHIDHIIPLSKDGETMKENLRTLCSKCNLGKKDKREN